MKKVLVCRCLLLPYSETFIREQVLSYTDWSPVLVGINRVAGLALDDIETRVLDPHPSLIGTAYQQLLRLLYRAPHSMVEQLRAEGAALIHVHFGVDAVALWPTIEPLGVPVVITLHGYDVHRSRESWERNWHPWVKRYPRRLLAIARQANVHFVAVSEVNKQRAIDYGIPADKISVQYIGVDTARFTIGKTPITQRRRRILCVGRLVEKKGGEFLIAAFARVKERVTDAELVMIGDGPLRASLAALAERLHIPVVFAGSLSSTEVKQHIDQARVLCAPSITAQDGDAEGLPMVLLEAQACGVPVITSAEAGSIEAIIPGVTGFAFPERDVATLSDYLIKLLIDDELATAMSQAAPQFIAQNFELRNCTKRLEALYDSLLSRQRNDS